MNLRDLPVGSESSRTMYARRKSLIGFKLLVLFLYGRHSSVTWLSATRCRVATSTFARTIGTIPHKVKSCCEWLEANRYLRDVDSGRGYIEFDVVQPIVRRGGDEDDDADEDNLGGLDD